MFYTTIKVNDSENVWSSFFSKLMFTIDDFGLSYCISTVSRVFNC